MDFNSIALEYKDIIPRSNTFDVKQVRSNNKSFENFYDAKYIDLRNCKKAAGNYLCVKRRELKEVWKI